MENSIYGYRKVIEEIEAKREIEYRTLFQVKKHSGEFMMWSNAESSFVQCAPSDGYIFDVLVKNSGGYKTFTDMQLYLSEKVITNRVYTIRKQGWCRDRTMLHQIR